MNEAFEKILERLEESYIDCFHQGDYKFNNAIDKAEQIVREVAEEFATDTNVGTNGWIACSERLPKKNGFYLATLDGEIAGEDKPFTGMAEFEDGKWIDDEDDYKCVLAWQPLPEPYKESEE